MRFKNAINLNGQTHFAFQVDGRFRGILIATILYVNGLDFFSFKAFWNK